MMGTGQMPISSGQFVFLVVLCGKRETLQLRLRRNIYDKEKLSLNPKKKTNKQIKQ